MQSRSYIDVNYSGTTAITVFIHGKVLMCANTGDSRALIGKYINNWEVIELSHDHKPDNIHEKHRIEQSGGRVEPYKDASGLYVGPFRVWKKYEQVPGLAISRSIGDLVAGSVGVICEPEVLIYNLNFSDKFLVVATDGVWEYVNNRDCVRIVKKFYEKNDIDGACEALLEYTNSEWKKNNQIVDDVTFIIVFFNIP